MCDVPKGDKRKIPFEFFDKKRKITVLWDVMPCGLVDIYQCSEESVASNFSKEDDTSTLKVT
jgi:hypothetical protein